MEVDQLSALRDVTSETGALVADSTAAQLWGMRLRRPPEHPTLLVARSRSKVRRKGYRIRRAAVPEEVWLVDGIRVTSRLRTVVDCARILSVPEGVVVADSALQKRLITPKELMSAAAKASGPGSVKIRQVAALADGRSQSVPETLLRLIVLSRPELGPVVPQFTFAGRSHAYDLALTALLLVIEFQSWEFHGEKSVWKKDARWGNEAYAEGWGYLQVVWEDLEAGADHVVEMIMTEAHNRDA